MQKPCPARQCTTSGPWGGRSRSVTAAVSLAIGLQIACAGSTTGPIDLDGGRGFRLPEGSYVEANLQMAAGATITAAWETTNETVVDWNVHSHPVSGLVTHDQGSGIMGTIAFTAPAAGGYSVTWERARATTELILDLRFEGAITVEWVAP